MIFQHILENFYFKKKSEFENIFPNMDRVHSNSRSGVDSTWTPLDSLPNLLRFGRESI